VDSTDYAQREYGVMDEQPGNFARAADARFLKLKRAGKLTITTQDLYQTTNIWLAHLNFTRQQWAALEPSLGPKASRPLRAWESFWTWTSLRATSPVRSSCRTTTAFSPTARASISTWTPSRINPGSPRGT
jgi:hypothetical protein